MVMQLTGVFLVGGSNPGRVNTAPAPPPPPTVSRPFNSIEPPTENFASLLKEKLPRLPWPAVANYRVPMLDLTHGARGSHPQPPAPHTHPAPLNPLPKTLG